MYYPVTSRGEFILSDRAENNLNGSLPNASESYNPQPCLYKPGTSLVYLIGKISYKFIHPSLPGRQHEKNKGQSFLSRHYQRVHPADVLDNEPWWRAGAGP